MFSVVAVVIEGWKGERGPSVDGNILSLLLSLTSAISYHSFPSVPLSYLWDCSFKLPGDVGRRRRGGTGVERQREGRGMDGLIEGEREEGV